MIPFEYLEHTADVKFRAYGETPDEMFSNAAAALFKTMVDPATVQILETWKVELEAPLLEDLAYKWLSEIVLLARPKARPATQAAMNPEPPSGVATV